MAYIQQTAAFSNGFTVQLAGLATNFVGGRTTNWYVNNKAVGQSYCPDGVSEGGAISCYGYASGTTYNIKCDIYNYTTGSYLTSLSGTATTDNRPSNWSWTQAELNAFQNHGHTTVLTYTRWNAFIDKVNEFRSYKGVSLVPNSARMTSTDKVLTAARFNAVRLAIGSLSSTGITDRVAGDPVLGSYFITLANSLNAIA